MAVYVDKAKIPYRGMLMSHMVADTLDELHAMAKALDLRRQWFQDSASAQHYDICQNVRRKAILKGAIEMDRREFVNKIQELRRAR